MFYIAKSHQQKAAELIRKFLEERKFAKDYVLAAIPDEEVEGLSWGYEPKEADHKLWQQMTGDKEKASFSSLVALRIAPRFFQRLAAAHIRVGNVEEAAKFSQLAAQADQ